MNMMGDGRENAWTNETNASWGSSLLAHMRSADGYTDDDVNLNRGWFATFWYSAGDGGVEEEKSGDQPPELWDALGQSDWAKVLRILYSPDGRDQAQWRDQDGHTAIHLACSQDQLPVYIMRALIDADPTAASVIDRNGRTPLHLSVPYGLSYDLVRMILENAPKTASVEDRDGRTPSVSFFQKHHGVILCRLIQDERRRSCSESCQPTASSSISPSSSSSFVEPKVFDARGNDVFEISRLLIRAEMEGSIAENTPDGRDWNVLHASLSCRSCPPYFVELAIILQPEQAKFKNAEGRLPLHVAVTNLCHDNQNDQVITRLVSCYPGAAGTPDVKGRFPLALAIEAGKLWGEGVLEKILFAAPQVLGTRDIATHMYPFMIAAVDQERSEIPPMHPKNETKKDILQLTTIYCLLRENPAAVGTCQT